MPTLPESKEAVRKELIASYQEEYKELTANWTGLEGKAQGVVTISGIFIAGVFAYVRESKAESANYEKVFLIFSVSFLIAAVVIAVKALSIREVSKSPYGKNIENLASGFETYTNKKEFAEWARCFDYDKLRSWQKTTNSIAIENERKAGLIRKSINYLKTAILAVAILTITKLFTLITLYFGWIN